jgi:hypothetical protein
MGAALSAIANSVPSRRTSTVVVRKADDVPGAQDELCRILHRKPRRLVDDVEDLVERAPARVRFLPAGHSLGIAALR